MLNKKHPCRHFLDLYAKMSGENVSQIRQNYHIDSENSINEKINELLHASYVYLGIAFHFDRDDVALPNVHKYFMKLSEHKKEMADKLMKYQNSRGGRVVFASVEKPVRDDWGSVRDAFEDALELEKALNASFMHLHTIAETTDDSHLSDFVEEDLLEPQVKQMKEMGDLLSEVKMAGPGLGEYLFERESFHS
uniref:Ferritin n=2 Tax=Ascaris TaxID=6251 RepID=A0A0M3I2K5_ASCLU